jgi:hypothetical protein
VVEPYLKMGVRFLGKSGPTLSKVLHFRVIIDVEMVGLQNMPGEVRVLNLVPSEIEQLRDGCGCAAQEE